MIIIEEKLVDSVKLRYEIVATYRDDSLKGCDVTLPEVIYRLDTTTDHLKAFFIDETQLSEFPEYDVDVKVKVDKVRFRGSKVFIKV